MRTLLLLLGFLVSVMVSAQDEPMHSVGVRGGENSGITYRHFHGDFMAAEAMLSFRRDGLQATFLREHFKPTLGELGHNFYFISGYGVHAGFVNTSEFKFLFSTYEYPNVRISPLAGVDGYLGLEYRFKEVPIILGVDYKPYFEFSGYDFFSIHLWDTALMIKYVFK
jgi:hypothetical protein